MHWQFPKLNDDDDGETKRKPQKALVCLCVFSDHRIVIFDHLLLSFLFPLVNNRTNYYCVQKVPQ